MLYHNINKYLKRFLKDIFCGVSSNSPYKNNDFLQVLIDAAEHEDFINNTSKRVEGPTGETVFSRLKNADFEKIKTAFYEILKTIFPLVKRLIRNRKVAIAFDMTEEPYYGKIEGLWVHSYCEARGSTGCFKYLTVSAVTKENKFILGSLPVRVGADTVALVSELLVNLRKLVVPERLLFDRGFDSYELIESLQKIGIRYQILWRKDKWTKKILNKMKRNQVKEVVAKKSYTKHKSKNKLRVRFVFIKCYKRYNRGKAFDWVFATNVREKEKRFYVDKYKKRWGIETVFRVLDNIRIKTTTTNETIRYFLNMLCCLLYNLWKLRNLLGEYISLKNFVVYIVKIIEFAVNSQKGIT